MKIFPVLAETLADERIGAHVANDDWCAEQKLDGQRILIHVGDGGVAALNRKAEITAKDVPRGVIDAFRPLVGRGEWFFDGEMVGVGAQKVLWLFDLPYVSDHIDPSTDLFTRKGMLDGFYDGFFGGHPQVRLLPTATGDAAKESLVDAVRASGGEGVMFKHLDKPYDQPRNPNATQGVRSRWILKAKNRKTIDCVVTATKLDGKDNIQLGVIDPDFTGRTVPIGGWDFRVIGECTALAGDKDRIQKGDVVEVTYLYANDVRAPRLYQPTMPRIRTDKAPGECMIDQLVFTNREVLL